MPRLMAGLMVSSSSSAFSRFQTRMCLARSPWLRPLTYSPSSPAQSLSMPKRPWALASLSTANPPAMAFIPGARLIGDETHAHMTSASMRSAVRFPVKYSANSAIDTPSSLLVLASSKIALASVSESPRSDTAFRNSANSGSCNVPEPSRSIAPNHCSQKRCSTSRIGSKLARTVNVPITGPFSNSAPQRAGFGSSWWLALTQSSVPLSVSSGMLKSTSEITSPEERRSRSCRLNRTVWYWCPRGSTNRIVSFHTGSRVLNRVVERKVCSPIQITT
mmetsp:Transcript_61969/g.146107  ORF Transcript_61969/g.146107 Transcript_61969/m.146107 type:complete len:276 (-) Transcript_61969:408-1235(-)